MSISLLELRLFIVLGLVAAAGLAQAQTVAVEAPDAEASEAGDTATFTFFREGGDMSAALTVNFTFDSTTTAGQADYSTGTEFPFFSCCTQVTIPADAASADVTVTPLADNLDEGEERLDITLSTDANYQVGMPASAGVTIADDPAIVTLVATDGSANESGDTGIFTFSRTGGDISAALTVFFTFDGTTTASVTDYSTGNEFPFFTCCTQVTIPADAASADVTVTPLADNLAEGEESIDITLSADPTYQVGMPESASITIVDDPAVVTLVATNAVANESGDTGIFTFSRTGGNISAPLTVFFTFDGTTTASVSDYSTGNEFPFFTCCTQVTIPADAPFADVTVTPLADNLAEGEESIDITLRADPTYQVGMPESASVTIVDDAAIVTLVATDAEASEIADTGTFTFSRTGGNISAPLTVFFTFDGTTTASVTDYSTGNEFPFFTCCTQVTIPADASFADVTITPMVDNLDEGEESIDITLSSDSAYLVGNPESASITIADDDRIFEDDFELLPEFKSCQEALVHKSVSSRLHDLGPSVLDLDEGLEWLKCGVGAYFDWVSGDCQADTDMRLDSWSKDDAVEHFNLGQVGDNLGFNDWRWADNAKGACVVRVY